ncbi:TetR/AcrR family transcriptional regulator [Streptomyces xanthophaeus]|uniref:TetR/AcrR family transcriptional regulator n=1 Tax=Streptomyces xanthophaeus TaxID=67385 RepID=UPI00264A2D1F|nr:TetR/AcrR family transcriptional regulator [Streptomyces xanthophaeus]WKD34418.1 TetR/AcrR family transcriptional regulator [Streptomyces xanthophaeus]
MTPDPAATASAPATARRAPAGAAVLRADVTEAIRDAVVEELAAVGFSKMSIEGIARRAGVGKTAVYRRWKSKLHLVLDLVGAFAVDGLPVPATGSLYGDVRALLEVMSHVLRHPVASAVIPDLLVEAARNPEIADAVRGALLDGQRRMAEGIVSDAVARGELPAGIDPAHALDLLIGPLYWRQVVVRDAVTGSHLDVLARQVVAGLKASSGPGDAGAGA